MVHLAAPGKPRQYLVHYTGEPQDDHHHVVPPPCRHLGHGVGFLDFASGTYTPVAIKYAAGADELVVAIQERIAAKPLTGLWLDLHSFRDKIFEVCSA